MNDELPDLRVLDQPFEVPEEFRTRLRADLLATFDEAGADVVPLQRVVPGDTRPRRRREVIWGVAAAAVLVIAVGIGLIVLDRSNDGVDELVVSDISTACERFIADAEPLRSIEAPLDDRITALDLLVTGLEALTADLARLGDVDATDLANLGSATGAFREARLDLEGGDQAGSAAAIEFATDRLDAVAGVEIGLAGDTVICR